MWYYVNIIKNTIRVSETDLINKFIEKGGKVNKYYLHKWNRNKRTLVYLHGWFSGRNFREAILKALG